MIDRRLPKTYRWLIQHGLTDWEPWYFIDDASSVSLPADLTKSAGLQNQFRLETGADYEVYLFARRQDQDELAYFVVSPEGVIEDNVQSCHLAFSGGPISIWQPNVPRPTTEKRVSLFQWLKNVALTDVEDWISLEDDCPK